MYNTGVFHSIKQCVSSAMFFGFKHDGTFCHHIVLRIRISMTDSKDDIISIKILQLSTISRYGKVVINKEWRLSIIGIISLCGLVMYASVSTEKISDTFFCYYNKYSRLTSYFRHHFEIRILDTFSSKIISLNQVSGFLG